MDKSATIRNKQIKHNHHLSLDHIPPGQVTNQSLLVWKELPPEIRKDPTWTTFHIEESRLSSKHNRAGCRQPVKKISSSCDEMDSNENVEFIRIKHLNSITNDLESEGFQKPKKLSPKSTIIERIFPQDMNFKHVKKIVLIIFWLLTTGALICKEERTLQKKLILIPSDGEKFYELPKNPIGDSFQLTVLGPFGNNTVEDIDTNFISIEVLLMENNNFSQSESFIDPWTLSTVDSDLYEMRPKLKTKTRDFQLTPEITNQLRNENGRLQLKITQHNSSQDLALQIIYNPSITDRLTGAYIAIAVLVVFYVLLMSEVLDRTFVALIISIGCLAILAVLGQRPTMQEIAKWMDLDTLMLLFCMMIFVAILTETGVFDYLAVLAFEISKGKVWPMITCLCIFTCCVSAFLDNITTVLLMTPVAIRLSEVLQIDAVPIIMAVIIHANIGGALSPIADPITIIISSNRYIINHEITFLKFIKHAAPGVILTVIQSCLQMRFMFPTVQALRLTEPKVAKDLKLEIKVWQRAANSLSTCPRDAEIVRLTLLKKVISLQQKLKKLEFGAIPINEYLRTLDELKTMYPIKNPILLTKTVAVLALVIAMFFIQSIPDLQTLPPGWVALFGAILLLIATGREDIDEMMPRIQWTTLLFFASMFVTMECFDRLGLIASIGALTEQMILAVGEEFQLAMAIFLILWISALSSAVVDSLPITAMMVRVVVSLVEKKSLNLPLHPLVWALTFGASFGGNGTLFGSSANVVAVDIAEQHGYTISFKHYFRIVFPIMICQITVATGYLFVAHIIFQFN